MLNTQAVGVVPTTGDELSSVFAVGFDVEVAVSCGVAAWGGLGVAVAVGSGFKVMVANGVRVGLGFLVPESANVGDGEVPTMATGEGTGPQAVTPARTTSAMNVTSVAISSTRKVMGMSPA